jgi:hypothetical protein
MKTLVDCHWKTSPGVDHGSQALKVGADTARGHQVTVSIQNNEKTLCCDNFNALVSDKSFIGSNLKKTRYIYFFLLRLTIVKLK